MIALLPAFLAGWVLTVALLAIEHLLWKDARRVVRYCLGAGAICTGCTFAGLILDNPVLVFGPWVIASAGLVIAIWTWFEDRAREHQDGAQRRGEVIGLARRLEREIERDAQRPGQDRQN